MKTPAAIRLAWMIVSSMVLFSLPACTTSGSGANGQLTLHQIHLQVDRSMERYYNAAFAGNVTVYQRKQIDQAYKEFKAAYDAAAAEAGGPKQAKTTPASENVKASAERFIQAVAPIF